MKRPKTAQKTLISDSLKKFLLNKGFVSVGTCDLGGQPNAVPKYIIKIDKDFVYLADYVMGQTVKNLTVNPRISLSTVDMKTLEGWQINGVAMMITKGAQHKKLFKAMIEQEVRHSAKRIMEDVRGIQKYDTYQVSFPEKVVMLKVKCKKITKIGITGKLQVDQAI